MSAYKTSKKVRYISSIVFILFMAFIVGGTLISQQQAGTMTANDMTSP